MISGNENDPSLRGPGDLSIFAGFVNSLPEKPAESGYSDFYWHPIPREFKITKLAPELGPAAATHIPEHALLSRSGSISFSEERSQFDDAIDELCEQGLVERIRGGPSAPNSLRNIVNFFQSELWRPEQEISRPYLGTIRVHFITNSYYAVVMGKVIEQVNLVRYVRDQAPIPKFPY